MTPSGPETLLIGLAAGSEQAYAQLYEQFGTRLYRAAVAMLGRREDAEDAVQEVFAALVRSQEKLPGVNDLTAYLFTALRHAASRCAECRQRDAQNLAIASESACRRCSAQTPPENVDAERLQHAITRLPTEQREVVSLRIAGELTFAEIAAVLNISQNTAASRYRYALEKLRATMLPSPVERNP